MKPRTLAVAITGGIASGKSELASAFREMGARVISADLEAKAILAGDRSVRRKIIGLLGGEAYASGGKVNRAFIADRIFSRPPLRRRVNAIVHPPVIRRVKRMIAGEKRSRRRRMVVVEAALIYEAGMEDMFDAVIMVNAPAELRIARIRRRDGITRREAMGRIQAQGSNRKKASVADFIVANRGDLRALRRSARFLHRLLSGIAGSWS
ncbi:MAG TPA: dephospho-CoA kinase [Bacteroidota bacterium]|nr:dephospho-CoA kinase [Bacteroidota bacterium]